MKKCVSIILMLCMLFVCIPLDSFEAYASTKVDESRAIAIVFDNSGSMYDKGDQAWCRATYAMEVFASMLNTGDTLLIYPMNPITVDGKQYTMEKPFCITDAAHASAIREIFTEDAAGTPIESIDCAIDGLQQTNAEKKYMIVLTDGGTFSKDGSGLTKERTKRELDKRISEQAGKTMTVMYLGIGSSACVPDTEEFDYFAKKQAKNSEDVLSTLTEMCNQIFGRDILPKNHISGNTIEFDISMSKLILFVQGENISNLSLTNSSDKAVCQMISSRQTRYSTAGSGDYQSVPDTSLQGMMVTYADLEAGNYTIDYEGKATSVEVYYEPDADLDFVFTDAEGNDVDPQALYEGDYKISFGMKDAKTGELIASDLLGNPHYEGSYYVNGEEIFFTHDGYSGEVPVQLKMNDTFEATLTANYLSGYTITKDASDFGWPNGGIRVAAPPLGKFKVELYLPKDYIIIDDLGASDAIVAKLNFRDNPLTPEEFAAVTLQVDCDGIAYDVTACEQDSSYLINLKYTEGLQEGIYHIKATAKYSDVADRTAEAEDGMKLTLSNTPLWLKWATRLLLLLLIILAILLVMHIRVLPKRARLNKKDSTMIFDGEDESKATTFNAELEKGHMTLSSKYAGTKTGISMDVKPGKESYLRKGQTRRSAEVKSTSVRKYGSGIIQEATIGGVKYLLNEDTGKLERFPKSDKPFIVKHGTPISYSGTMMNAGVPVPFTVNTKMNFKKK